MSSAGFGKPEVGMILVGSMFGIFADIPLIVSRHSLLNINLGGALIPVIVSLAFIYQKKLEVFSFLFGLVAVSALSFSITRFEPGMGIIAEFPYYFLPSLLALFLSMILMKGHNKRIPYAYSTAVLGTLIGADLVRVPMLLDAGVLGSIGGAGAMDLVYLSGLMAVVPLVLFYYNKFPVDRAKDPMDEANRLMRNGKLVDGIHYARYALEKELWKSAKLITKVTGNRLGRSNYGRHVLLWLGLHPLVVDDYSNLNDSNNLVNREKAFKTFRTAVFMRETIASRTKDRFSSILRRILAYMIDLLLTTVPLLVLSFYMLNAMSDSYFGQMSPMFFAIFLLAISIQFIYFTLFEWYNGKSIGKIVLGLEVVTDDYDKISFIQSAARNSARYADMVLMFYLVSIILIVSGTDNKRIGDYIAGTRVVKVK